MLTSIDVKFIFDSVHLCLSSSANILQLADVALRIVFLLAEADNTLRNLHNSSYDTKAEFNNCLIIHSK